ncbi:MAG: hypothetical protein K8F91_08395, partial [Candidatus Obscuribacterales bacterium]|nr:hypothetical protein [Candidatus Obscuribacterales bacterium]
IILCIAGHCTIAPRFFSPDIQSSEWMSLQLQELEQNGCLDMLSYFITAEVANCFTFAVVFML